MDKASRIADELRKAFQHPQDFSETPRAYLADKAEAGIYMVSFALTHQDQVIRKRAKEVMESLEVLAGRLTLWSEGAVLFKQCPLTVAYTSRGDAYYQCNYKFENP